MKKYKKMAYIVLSIFILLSGFFIYNVSGQNKNSEDEMNKCLESIKQIETRFSTLFNDINNISLDNYKIKEVEEKNKESKDLENEKDNSSGGKQNKDNSNGSSGKNSSEGNNNSQSTGSSEEENKKYDLERNGILTGNHEPDWEKMKNDVENMYTFIYSNILDLYKNEKNQEYMVEFNKEYDNLTKAVKEEDKEASLDELSKLYDYLPIFIENCTDSQKEKSIIKTKSYIFKAYSMLERENWNEIYDNLNNANNEFTKLVTNVDNQENLNKYNVNKAYIIINELQNAVMIRDRDVFLIKYKNLLEELQNL